MSLWTEFLTNDKRLIHKWTHYFPIYEHHFARYVNRPMLFLEIGCGAGGSLQLWKRHFGPFAQIVGVDIVEACKDFEENQISRADWEPSRYGLPGERPGRVRATGRGAG